MIYQCDYCGWEGKKYGKKKRQVDILPDRFVKVKVCPDCGQNIHPKLNSERK